MIFKQDLATAIAPAPQVVHDKELVFNVLTGVNLKEISQNHRILLKFTPDPLH